MPPITYKQSPIVYKQFSVAIDEVLCSKCKICISICECFSYNEEKDIVEVNSTSCKGCGICISSCPSSAIYHIYDDSILNTELTSEEISPFDCTNCDYEYIEEGKDLIFCIRRFDTGKCIEAVADGMNVIVKKCLFSDKKIEDDERIYKLKKILKMFKMENKIKVE
ncbi:MAG TPA: hypothetical protein ENI33_06315 [Thermoplasmatales archaeon]|nr:hypothetical protein [Thermoplasmatales archaeon]